MNPARGAQAGRGGRPHACFGSAQAFTFETESVRGNFDSTLSMGTGMRANSPSCSLITDGAVDDKGARWPAAWRRPRCWAIRAT
jgi:hypothetical protein